MNNNDPRKGICAIMMLKDENRYILNEDGTKPKYTMLEQNLRRLSQIVESVYIVDNDSSDGSKSVYEKYYDKLIHFVQFNPKEFKFDDVRDREILLKKAKENHMKWLLVVDGDEIYEERATHWIHDFCGRNNYESNHTVKFHYINFWRGRTRYRTDAWNGSWFPRLFSMKDLILTGTALHNYTFGFQMGSSFTRGQVTEAPVKCLHYGWADWEHRVAKTQRYINRDMQLNHISYEHARNIYSKDCDEKGLTLSNADPLWGEEFRSGNIDY